MLQAPLVPLNTLPRSVTGENLANYNNTRPSHNKGNIRGAQWQKIEDGTGNF